MSSKKKILIIINSLVVGGGENQVANVMRLLSDRFEFHVITVLPNDPVFVRNNVDTDVVTIHPLNSGKSLIHFPAVFFKMLSLTKKIKPDLIHGVLFQANILARMMKAFTGIRTVNSVYDVSEEPAFNLRMLKLTNNKADRIFFDNTAGKKNYVAKKMMREDQVIYTPNGIGPIADPVFNEKLKQELLKRINFKEGESLWLNVSRLAVQKDHRTLIEAFDLLIGKFPANKLLLVGHGPLEQEIKDLITEKGLKDHIFFMGRINDVYTLCKMCGQYVCSSAWEGMPIIIMQAMLYKLPVVSTDVGAIPDLIENNITGYLCERRNPQALSKAMECMITAKEEEKENIREAAYKKITEEFSFERLKENWDNNYSAEINRN